MSRKFLIAVAAVGITLTASACNTVSGAGEDLQSASDEVRQEI